MKEIKNKKGFTIIEVVLVLAIAGLIFLMVFLALPALQRNQRDTSRKNSLASMSSQLANYQSSSRGQLPSTTAGTASGTIGGFVANYMAGDELFNDPQSNSPFTVQTTALTASSATGTIYYAPGNMCGEGGAVTNTGANARNFALVMKLENGFYCLDNR